jgi:hypothetical protein
MPDANNNAPIVKSGDDARAGVTGQNVRSVLVASLIGAILLLIAVAAVQFS